MNININISRTPIELGEKAASKITELINEAINAKGYARIILSTGASQFETLSSLIKKNIDWTKVEMFHLDEYVNLSESHPASFRKYLKERFVSKVNLKAAYFVCGEGDIEKNIEELTIKLREKQIDVGVIGIGENGHIAFNDPPADFNTDKAYKVVDLDERCRMQQVGEGWFKTFEDVPKQAITMCPREIMACKHIVSAVPHLVKAEPVFNTITKPISPNIPATIMKAHPDWNLFLDDAAASMLIPL